MKINSRRYAITSIICVMAFMLMATDISIAEPSDPPSASDYASPIYGFDDSLSYRRSGNNYTATPRCVEITTDNNNFVLSHACDSSSNKIAHYHDNKDYDDDFGGSDGTVTVSEGNSYWDDWFYSNVAPAISHDTNATIVTNCVCYAYDEYKSASTHANYWVDEGSASDAYRDELYEISPDTTDNSEFDTIIGDRCDDPTAHVWKVTDTDSDCPAKTIKWKNNASGTYEWNHSTNHPLLWTNDCPKGNHATNLYEDGYAIYNKVNR